MASDWIPYNVDLPRKPEVLAIAAATGRTVYEVVGSLLSLWGWADGQTTDGRLPGVGPGHLSAICPLADGHFTDAMRRAGWLVLHDGPEGPSVEFANFAAWMGGDAKRRAREARRRWRGRHDPQTGRDNARTKSGHGAVKMRPTEQDKTRQRNTPPRPPQGGGDSLPPELDTPPFRALWARWEQHRREKRSPLKPTTRAAQLTKLAAWGAARAAAALEHSIAQGWTGIFEPARAGGAPPATMEERIRRIREGQGGPPS